MDQMDKPWKYNVVRGVCLTLTALYLPLVISDAGEPNWTAPWIPGTGRGLGVLTLAAVNAVVFWANGWFLQSWLARRKKARSPEAVTGNKFEHAAFGRFLVRLVLIHSGAIGGVAASFSMHDARYAIVFAIPTALMILLVPRPKPLGELPLGLERI
jgi:hypothetical protein